MSILDRYLYSLGKNKYPDLAQLALTCLGLATKVSESKIKLTYRHLITALRLERNTTKEKLK
jgi:hypothetical protein